MYANKIKAMTKLDLHILYVYVCGGYNTNSGKVVE
jgi:hypothetical protein